jgi:fumarate hydratase subunit beta
LGDIKMIKRITTPLTKDKVRKLKAGDNVLLSGYIYTARDAAHKRFIDLIDNGMELPFEVKDSVIYYVGPSPTKPGDVIGSAGPTTSYRMDAYTPKLLELGLKAMIGKGKRSPEVIEAMKKYGAVYFVSIGGAAALTAKCVEESNIIAYEDLGSEAVRKLKVKDMPITVVIDSSGNNLYESGQRDYLDWLKK